MAKVLGIDPGFGRLGYAVLEKTDGIENIIDAGCLETEKSLQYGKRLVKIGETIEHLIATHKPNLVAIEKVFFNTNQKTASQIAETRGLILHITAKHNIDVLELSPPQIKLQITGYGRASKSQIQKMIVNILKLNSVPQPDDKADAIAIALCGLNSLSTPH